MSKTTIIFGVLLILLGAGTYFGGDPGPKRGTALIPSAVGLLIAICGVIAMNPNARKHAMHVAVLLGAIGFLAAVGRIVRTYSETGSLPGGLKMVGMGGMAILCGVFVALCVQSFIAVRKARG